VTILSTSSGSAQLECVVDWARGGRRVEAQAPIPSHLLLLLLQLLGNEFRLLLLSL
jgi:hypothetical protein